jgi:hypothetical protein
VRVERARALIERAYDLGEDEPQNDRADESLLRRCAGAPRSFQLLARSFYHCAHRDSATNNVSQQRRQARQRRQVDLRRTGRLGTNTWLSDRNIQAGTFRNRPVCFSLHHIEGCAPHHAQRLRDVDDPIETGM